MRALIKKLAKRSTVILSTHIMQEVNALCDRVLILRDGALALDRYLSQLQQGRFLLLRVGNCPPSLREKLEQLDIVAAVKEISNDGEIIEYSLALDGKSDADLAANEIARQVIFRGGQLYKLEAPIRDLESIFREVTASVD